MCFFISSNFFTNITLSHLPKKNILFYRELLLILLTSDRKNFEIEFLLEFPHDAFGGEKDDQDGDRPQNDQIKPHIFRKMLLQNDENGCSHNRACPRPETSNNEDEKELHGPADPKGFKRVDENCIQEK